MGRTKGKRIVGAPLRRAIAAALLTLAGAGAGTRAQPPEVPKAEKRPGPTRNGTGPMPREIPDGGTTLPSAAGAMRLVPFEHSPFPYDGVIPDTGKPFLDAKEGERRGHTSPRGGVLWEDQTYKDRRSLVFIPKTFDLGRPAVIVLYLHGNLATLARDVVERQRVPLQLAQSRLNAVLLAPQLASNALDSSAGHFWLHGVLGQYLDEASKHLAELYGDKDARAHFANLPVIIVAYSGGYLPSAYSLQWGGVENRIKGVILLDALFGEVDKFSAWIARRHGLAFFVSAYSDGSREQNAALQQDLAARGIGFSVGEPGRLQDGVTAFVFAGGVDHNSFVSRAWIAEPLRALLAKVGVGSPAAPDAPMPPVRPDAGEGSLPGAGGDVSEPPGGDSPPPRSPYGALKGG